MAREKRKLLFMPLELLVLLVAGLASLLIIAMHMVTKDADERPASTRSVKKRRAQGRWSKWDFRLNVLAGVVTAMTIIILPLLAAPAFMLFVTITITLAVRRALSPAIAR